MYPCHRGHWQKDMVLLRLHEQSDQANGEDSACDKQGVNDAFERLSRNAKKFLAGLFDLGNDFVKERTKRYFNDYTVLKFQPP